MQQWRVKVLECLTITIPIHHLRLRQRWERLPEGLSGFMATETNRPLIQIDDLVREMTEEEYADLLASGWTPEKQDDE